jgi:hypothetical protein
MGTSYRLKKRWLKGYCVAHHQPIRKGFRIRVNRWGKPARLMWENALALAGRPITHEPTADNIDLIKPFRVKLMEVVRSQIGTKEWPPSSNWGEVAKYLKAAGFSFPTPWCASFVTWSMKKAGWRRNLPKLLGWVPSWESWAKERGYTVSKVAARKGDIVTFNWDSDAAGEHIGFVTSNLGPLKGITTIEGNATSGAIPGGGVVKKTRLFSQVNTVIRLPNY